MFIEILNNNVDIEKLRFLKTSNQYVILSVNPLGLPLEVKLPKSKHLLNHLGKYQNFKYKVLITKRYTKQLLDDIRAGVPEYAERLYKGLTNSKTFYTHFDTDYEYKGGDISDLLQNILKDKRLWSDISITLRDKDVVALMLRANVAQKFRLATPHLIAVGNNVLPNLSRTKGALRYAYRLVLMPEACYFIGRELLKDKKLSKLGMRLLNYARGIEYEGYKISTEGKRVLRNKKQRFTILKGE